MRRSTILLLALMVGCTRSNGKPTPLAPQFTTVPRTQKDMSAEPLSSSDQPGALYDNRRIEQSRDDVATGGIGHNPVSKTVRDNVVAPSVAATAPTARAPSTRAASTKPASTQLATTGPASTQPLLGQYLIVGGVVAEVNGVPIYANKVLELVEPVLAARAKEVDRTTFRMEAEKEIMQQMLALRNLELTYAAAERNLDQKDKDIANAMTMQWKQQQIVAAGGSLEVAKRAALDRGDDFEEMLSEQYRVNMSRLYLQKKIWPRIAVSAADIREYYERHRDRDFTRFGAARFRLIKIDVRKAGGREQALDKITGLRNRIAKAGEPFESLARAVNDDPRWLKTGGDLGQAFDQGSFAIDSVEKAVWETPVGEVTPVIDANNAFYIALVESKTTGEIMEFDDEATQLRIKEILSAEQFNKLRREEEMKLVKESIIRMNEEMKNTAVEMAMQSYPMWAAK